MIASLLGRMKLPHRIRMATMASALCLLGSSPARAAFTVTGAGINDETNGTVAASATFIVTGNTLTLILTNASATATTVRGDALQGVVFNISGTNPTLTLTNIALTNPGNDLVFTSDTASNTSQPLSGSYSNVLGSSPIAEFGVSSTGFNGGFAAGNLALGTGGTDFGIVANGTFPDAGASSSFKGAFPLIQNSLTFTFTGINGVAESRITDVRFLFGTDGSGVITPQTVPEPSSLALMSLAGATLGLAALRRRRGHAR